VTGDRDDDDGRPWHERTSTVVGASVAGLAVIGILFLLISYVAGEFNEPDQAPPYYLDPGTSSSSRTSSSTTTTTTETVSSTSPPVTTDINPSDGSTTSGTDTSGSETSTTDTTTRTTRETDDEPSVTRSRPRLNETRTLYPRP
jgi:hypothetical protein